MNRPTRRKLVIGPGFLLAVAFAGVVLWQRRDQPKPPPPPAPATREAPPPIAPEPGWLLRHADEVELTPAQRDKLAAQAAAWRRATSGERDEMDRAGAELEAFLATRPPGEAALQDAAGAYAERSASLAVQRQEAWNWARAQLTEGQLATVDRLRAEAPLELR